jgi:MYXO-CTERM domain-containing protein
VDYAWGDPGDRIRTGQKTSSGNMVNTVTDSGSVGLLALGAAGLIAWRKRRRQTR